MKKTKLTLHRQTLRNLDSRELRHAAGGVSENGTCPATPACPPLPTAALACTRETIDACGSNQRGC